VKIGNLRRVPAAALDRYVEKLVDGQGIPIDSPGASR
jgi:hypothetical protein